MILSLSAQALYSILYTLTTRRIALSKSHSRRLPRNFEKASEYRRNICRRTEHHCCIDTTTVEFSRRRPSSRVKSIRTPERYGSLVDGVSKHNLVTRRRGRVCRPSRSSRVGRLGWRRLERRAAADSPEIGRSPCAVPYVYLSLCLLSLSLFVGDSRVPWLSLATRRYYAARSRDVSFRATVHFSFYAAGYFAFTVTKFFPLNAFFLYMAICVNSVQNALIE